MFGRKNYTPVPENEKKKLLEDKSQPRRSLADVVDNTKNVQLIEKRLLDLSISIGTLEKDKSKAFILQSNLQKMEWSDHIQKYIIKNESKMDADFIKRHGIDSIIEEMKNFNMIEGLTPSESFVFSGDSKERQAELIKNYKNLMDGLPKKIQVTLDNQRKDAQYWDGELSKLSTAMKVTRKIY